MDADRSSGDRSASVERFLTVVAEVFGVEELAAGDHFLDLGGDSLDAVIVMDRIDLEFGVRPELDMFFQSESVSDLAQRWWEQVVQVRSSAPMLGGD